MNHRTFRTLGIFGVAVCLLVGNACGPGGAAQVKDEYSSLPEACKILHENDIRGVIGEDVRETRRDPNELVPTTDRTTHSNCWLRFIAPEDADGSVPYRQEIQVRLTLYTSYSDKAGVHWAKIGYRQGRDLFEKMNPTPVENLGNEASTWYETKLFVGAHTLFRDSNLVVEVTYGGSDPLSPEAAKRGTVRLARTIAKKL